MSMEQARKAVSAKPADHSGYNLLAAALIHRAEETLDDGFYEQARDAVSESLKLSPDDFETLKLKVMVLLGEHDYPAALTEAQALNKRVPDDVTVYGLLTDAYSALGNYKDAEPAAQLMLNLLPGNLPAFVHTAHLREAFGDPNGSYDALYLAFQGTAPTETSDRASLLTQMGRERRLAGTNDLAEKLLKQALELFSGYHPATEELASVYEAQHRYDDAVTLLRQLQQALPTARNTYALAEGLALAGQANLATSEFAEFLREALRESASKNNANRELVFYYADRAHQPAKALEIAAKERVWRHDISTLDAYAWALHVSGQDAEARKQMDIALAVGTREPAILAHSSQITRARQP